jgi:prepilin-type N-terminal cleavage/methylation domain-containing protein
MNNKMSNSRYERGFTLIELIVVITVIAVLSTIGTVSLVNYSRVQALNQATSDLVQSLNTAKSLSSSQLKTFSRNGNINTYSCLNQSLSGYGVAIRISIDQQAKKYSYSFYLACMTNTGIMSKSPDPDTTTDLQTILPHDVVIDPATNITDVFFPVLSGGFVTKGTGAADSIILTSYGNTKTIKFVNGYISVK